MIASRNSTNVIYWLLALLFIVSCTPSIPPAVAETARRAIVGPTPTPTIRVIPTRVAPVSVQAADVGGLQQVYYNELGNFSLLLPREWSISQPQQTELGERVELQAPQAAAGHVLIADARQFNLEQLIARLTCADCAPATLQQVLIGDGVSGYYTLIGNADGTLYPWYALTSADRLILFSIYDLETRASLDAIVHSFAWGAPQEATAENVAAAQAARLQFAERLGVNRYQVTIAAVRPLTWPDSCLGVYTQTASCAPVNTPGYAVTLTFYGAAYQVHTDQYGARMLWLPTPGALPGSAAHVRAGQPQTGAAPTCQLTIVDASGARVGGCSASLGEAVPADAAGDVLQQMIQLLATLAPFHAETEQGLINFNGVGVAVADEQQRQQIVQLLEQVAATQTVVQPPDNRWLVLQRQSATGICDELTIRNDATVLMGDCQGQPQNSISLNEEQQRRVDGWVVRYAPFESSEYIADVVLDGWQATLTFNGSGDILPNDGERQSIVAFANELIVQSKRSATAGSSSTPVPVQIAVTATPTQIAIGPPVDHGYDTPGDVVEQFMLALLRNNSNQPSMPYLGSQLRRQIANGADIRQLVGIGNEFPSFNYLVTDSGSSGTALVDVTLQLQPAVKIVFELTQENEIWYINAIRSG